MVTTEISYTTFLHDFEQTLKHLFNDQNDINQLSLERGLPASIMSDILSKNPLSVAIPEEYGGRGAIVKECLGILSAASYESLSLSLIFGINIALFLEPVAKYGDESVKKAIFDRFLQQKNMGGLMITEPDYGSDALNMKTANWETENGYRIQGTKHWQGLTGKADYWLMTSRKRLDSGELGRDIDIFICDDHQEEQKIVVEKLFDNLGLYMIPYGLNKVDVEVPKNFKLIPETTGIKMLLDILHRSRLQFPGMGMGFIKRMLDEAINHCRNRIVGAGNLLSMDQVQFQLSRIQSAYTICSAMCARSANISSIEHNLASEGLQANSMKAVVTDLMQESAQTLVQLSGANGYKITNIGGRGIMDSRPFQIFEGSNEMLYSQISDIVTRTMKKLKETNLYTFLKGFDLTSHVVDYFKEHVNFTIESPVPMRKQVDLGKILGRIISLSYVAELGDKGFRSDLIDNCFTNLKQEIGSLVSAFHANNTVSVVEDYQENSAWLDFA